MEQTSPEIGVLVGRFQVDNLHPAHVSLINTVCQSHKRVLVFLGVTPVLVTKRNPLDFITRKEMLLQQFPSLTVLSLPDMPNDEDWSKELDKRIREACPIGNVMLYGGRDSFHRAYSGVFPYTAVEQITQFSGTEVRKEISQTVKASPDFRAGVIFAAFNQYPKVYPTVDVAIIDKTTILLGRKAYQTLYRFVGGFVDPSDENIEAAALREAAEETGLQLGAVQYVGTARINDWRYRNEEDKIITTLFVAEYRQGTPLAQDDIAELAWFDIAQLTEQVFVEEHRVLFRLLKNKYLSLQESF